MLAEAAEKIEKPQVKIAGDIEKACGVKMDTLMRMQSSYDIARTRERQSSIRVRRYQPSEARP